MRKITVIPARAKSNRIKNKNIIDFFGKPLLVRAIEIAKNSQIFDEIYVSSDSFEFLEIAKKNGAKTLLRSEDLSSDFATTLSVMKNACEVLNVSRREIICCLYATSPLLSPKTLQNALQKLMANPHKNYVFSCAKFNSSVFRSFKLKDDLTLSKFLFDGFQKSRSQDLEHVFYDAGGFYFGFGESFLEEREIFSSSSLCEILNWDEVSDINTSEDLNEAKAKFHWLNFN